MLRTTDLKTHIPGLAVLDDLGYEESAPELQASSDAQSQAVGMGPVQTHLLQLPAPGDTQRHVEGGRSAWDPDVHRLGVSRETYNCC